jgi:hypothetical protein
LRSVSPLAMQAEGEGMTATTRAVILGLAAILIGLPLPTWAFFFWHVVPDGHPDFRANYTAGYMVRTGKPLYDFALESKVQTSTVPVKSLDEVAPFIHPAYEALVYVPLSFLTYLQAYWVWFSVNLIILVCVYYLLRPQLSALSVVTPWLPAASFAAFLPIGAAMVQGQDSLLVLLPFAAAFAYFRDPKRLWVSGILLGLTVFRFQIFIPIILCFLFWRRWKVVVGSLLTALAAAVLSTLVAGFRPYVETLLGLSVKPELASWNTYLQPTWRMPNLRGLIQSLGGSDWIVLVASLTIMAIAVLAGKRSELQQQFSLAIVLAVLVSYHCFVHDLSILFIPLALLIGTKQQAALGIIGVCFFTPTLIAFIPDHSYLAVFAVLALFAFLATDLMHSGKYAHRQVSTVAP